MGYYSSIPYYLALLIVAGFFIYISPGLLDRVNGIRGYQFFLISLYIFFWMLYPIFYLLAIGNAGEYIAKQE